MTIAVASAKPKPLIAVAPVAYSAPLVTSPVVTATSSQVFARNYNTLAEPVVAAYTAGAPLVSAAAPVAAAYTTSPYAAAYTTSPYAAAYTSPYAAAYSYSPFAYSAYAF